MNDDAELLRRYAETRSEAAFAAVVQRHLDLVYQAALRRCGGDAHRAQDITQQVFTTVARDAAALAGHPLLTGWLYIATRHLAAKALREDSARRRRETAAHLMQEIQKPDTSEAEWTRLRPELDRVLDTLADADRNAILLRFFEGRPFAEIGAALRLSEDAARMRVERALEKLRASLARRGVTSTAAALGLALAGHAATAAPVGLAATVTGTALAGGAATVAVAGSGAAIFSLMSATKLQVGLAAALAVAGTGVVVQERSIAQLRAELAHTPAPSAPAQPPPRAATSPTAAQLPAPTPDELELARLRAELAALAQAPRPMPDRATLEAALRQARAQLALQGQRYTGAHPVMLSLQSSITELERLLGPESIVYPANAVDTPPQPRSQARAIYPFELRRNGVPGQVTVDIVVDASGAVADAVAVQATLPDFAAAAEQTVKKWMFAPGVKDGVAVKTNLRLPVVFSTPDAPAWF